MLEVDAPLHAAPGAMMKRVIMGLLAVVIGIVLVVRLLPSERVYPVATVVAGLRQHPRAWAGRTILVRGLELGENSTSVCTYPSVGAGGSCHQTTWLRLGTGDAPPPAKAVAIPLKALSPVLASSTLHWGRVTTIYIYTADPAADLNVVIVPGAHVPEPAAPPGWLTALRSLPIAGPAFARLFPWDGGVTLQVRLAAHPCSPPSCSDGALVGL